MDKNSNYVVGQEFHGIRTVSDEDIKDVRGKALVELTYDGECVARDYNEQGVLRVESDVDYEIDLYATVKNGCVSAEDCVKSIIKQIEDQIGAREIVFSVDVVNSIKRIAKVAS